MVSASLMSSTDGTSYRTIRDFQLMIDQEKIIHLDGVKARWFRIEFPPLTNRDTIGVAEIEFLAGGEEAVAHCRPGENELETICANPWKNRMIGESRPPPDKRKVVLTNFRMSLEEFKGMELMEAGLLGPVRLVASQREELEFP